MKALVNFLALLMITFYMMFFSADSRSEDMGTTLNLEDTLIDVKGWMNLVKLKMNTEKTEFIIFGHNKQLEKCVTQQINVVGDMIDRSSCIYYLGAFQDENLTLKEPVKRKSGTSIRNFYKIKKIRKVSYHTGHRNTCPWSSHFPLGLWKFTPDRMPTNNTGHLSESPKYVCQTSSPEEQVWKCNRSTHHTTLVADLSKDWLQTAVYCS